jgi:2-dehydropantoate 2-reductase
LQILIVGIGALGGTIAARAIRAGLPVRLAARNTDSAEALRRAGLRLSGIGGEVRADAIDVASVEDYGEGDQFDLILLATKAQDALEIASRVVGLLAPQGVILPIQNGGVARMLADRVGEDKVLGGFSNLGATMVEPGVYEQKNAGHLLIGELAGGVSERVARVAHVLGRAIEVKVSSNLTGAIWSKLLINCSVTTLGALCSTRPWRHFRQAVAPSDG